VSFAFVKGHGTGNDFLVLPDLDGSVHGELAASVVTALCDRHTGLGADGVLRVLSGNGGAPWFMDYRNADGSVSEMCGNGVRVFARYLQAAGLVESASPLRIDTHAGVREVSFRDDGQITVTMGVPTVGNTTSVTSHGVTYAARAVETGNPHAVAIVDSLDAVGDLDVAPGYLAEDFPHGVNIEFVEVRDDSGLTMRVHERGVGETASCGTGAVAAAAAVAVKLGREYPASYSVHVRGGELTVRLDRDGTAYLTGPAVLVAEGTWTG
jgi:diaminopimelate epimerase